jgi:hypothetical protein
MQPNYKNPIYNVWRSMRDRCLNPRYRQYEDYGGRGIKICERWGDFQSFVQDMGERPPGYSLDRIDNDGDYEPGNCRWADRKTQQRNQRRAVYVEIEGIKYRAIELAEQYGLKPDTIINRASKGERFSEVVSSTRQVYREGLALGGVASGARQKAKTHCPRGHEYSPENTYISPQGWRTCRACHNAKMRRRNLAKREGLAS